jgi:hypothetical protein
MITTEIEYNEALEKVYLMMDLLNPKDVQIKQMKELAMEIEDYEEKLF